MKSCKDVALASNISYNVFLLLKSKTSKKTQGVDFCLIHRLSNAKISSELCMQENVSSAGRWRRNAELIPAGASFKIFSILFPLPPGANLTHPQIVLLDPPPHPQHEEWQLSMIWPQFEYEKGKFRGQHDNDKTDGVNLNERKNLIRPLAFVEIIKGCISK